MKLEKFVLGMVGTNCYLVENEETNEVVIVDLAACPDYFTGHLKTKGLKPAAVLLTHGHFDHIMGLSAFLKEFDVPVYAYEEEESLLKDASLNCSVQFGGDYTFSGASYVKDGEILKLAGMDFKVLATPGHTKGGCCYYMEAEKTVFSGDTLFAQSVGRTDFPTGSMSVLVRSIKEKLLCLPEETAVYPGHMEATSIGEEKRHNPFL